MNSLAIYGLYLAGVMYLVCGVGLVVYFALRGRTPCARLVYPCLVFALFFALSIIGGHGIAPVPASWVIVGCALSSCSRVYGDYGLLYFGLLPLAAQWLVAMLVVLLIRGTRRLFSRKPAPSDMPHT